MTLSRRTRRRAAWAVPALAAAAVVTVATLVPLSVSATDAPELPARTPAELLAAVRAGGTQALAGEVVQTTRLGLPELPGSDGAGAFDWRSLLAGSRTVRVWVDGPQRQRLALLGQFSESDVVRNGRDVWTYQSGTQQVDHLVLPQPDADQDAGQPSAPPATAVTPQDAASRALAAVDPTTSVTVDATQRVAGRDAYTLVLTPRDGTTLVRKVAIAVDSRTSVPLRVQVFGTDPARAAVETGFTRIDMTRPPASVFAFTPPAGATVRERQLPVRADEQGRPPAAADPGPRPRVVGTGWSSVLVLPAQGAPQPATGESAQLLDRLTTRQPDGSRLLRSSLLSVLFATDGRVLVGAVGPEALTRAAG